MFTKDQNDASGSEGISVANQAGAMEIILSKGYRQASFDLALFANDGVIKSFNALFQSAYNMASTKNAEYDLIFKIGDLLLAIRKSVGNESTKMKNFEMLKWMINDIDKYVDDHGNPKIG